MFPLLAVLAACAPDPPAKPIAAAPLAPILARRAADLETDAIFPVYASPDGSVALMMLGPGQTIPTHVQGEDTEAILRVSGHVRWRTDSTWEDLPADTPTLLSGDTPRAFQNPGAEPAAYLVFAHPAQPPLRFVAPDTPSPGTVPALPAFAMRTWDTEATLPADGKDTVLYVLSGKGTLRQGEGTRPIEAGWAAVLHRDVPVTVHPDASLVVAVFEASADATASPPPPAPLTKLVGPVTVDALATLARRTAAEPTAHDLVETIYRSSVASVHVHGIGAKERTPLHVHRRSGEATLVLSGAPDVTLAWGAEGRIERWEGRSSPGNLLFSPPGCAHQWVNDGTEMQANLVFALPAFDENFYIDAADPRLATAPPPIRVAPDGEAALFDGRLRVVRVPSGGLDLPVRPEVHTVIAAIRGAPELDGAPLSGIAVTTRDAPHRLTGDASVVIFEPPATEDAEVSR